ncbi:MAG TPA: dienelactone hydrolase family protein [Candidatus Binataceae bacterium]|nr:dienelactone hydrolase family protein [Candidatus Binataceae bacterium]
MVSLPRQFLFANRDRYKHHCFEVRATSLQKTASIRFAVIALICTVLATSSVRVEARVTRKHRHPLAAKIQPINGQFFSDGQSIDEYHCLPPSAGKHPVVMLIHGCAAKGFGAGDFKRMCVSLAEHGYYATVVEYYGRNNGQPNCRQLAMDASYNPGPREPIPDDTWLRTMVSGATSLAHNPKADVSRLGLVGFSFGGTLALIEAVLYPNFVNAIVDYYGFSSDKLQTSIAKSQAFPPTLILQGADDRRSPASDSVKLGEFIATRQDAHDVHVYSGVGHGFNFREADGYDSAEADDAWRRTLSFLDHHLK